MKILVTSARMPFALAVMRRLRQAGHDVFSSDTYEAAPGNHSRYVTAHTVTASPRADTERFVEQVAAFCSEHGIDVIVPTWEEAFYLATARERLEQVARLYTPRSRRWRGCTTSTPSKASSSSSASGRPSA